MTDQRPVPARPDAVKTINGRPLPGATPGTVVMASSPSCVLQIQPLWENF